VGWDAPRQRDLGPRHLRPEHEQRAQPQWGKTFSKEALKIEQVPLPANALPGRTDIGPARGGLAWIVAGVGATTLALLGSVVVTLAKVAVRPRTEDPVRLQVTGHQWWWEIRYLSEDPSQTFRSANEIHIPDRCRSTSTAPT
jgi:hypothetical protein